MTNPAGSILAISNNTRPGTFASLITLALIVATSQVAQAQTLTVLHNFMKGADGAVPYAGLTIDQAGRLYGTTTTDSGGLGTVFRMSHQGSGWTLTPLHRFRGGPINGQAPEARVVFGPEGLLYGTTQLGGNNNGGIAFSLSPPATFCASFSCAWDPTVLYNFVYEYGYNLDYGDLAFDPQGNIYGTDEFSGTTCAGAGGGGGGPYGNVWRLSKSGQNWTKTILYNFENFSAGAEPQSGVIRDATGNLYGTTFDCGDPQCNHFGTVFELTSQPGACWAEQDLHVFSGSDGKFPTAGLVADGNGNLYGATSTAGSNGGGTIFELSPSSGGWTFQVLYNLAGTGFGGGPQRNLMVDAAGNLYGTTYAEGAFGYGSVFKLSPGSGGWTYTSLHDFTGATDGGYPLSQVVMDANGNLYGTTSAGGTGSECSGGCGVVWQITP